MAVLEDGSGSGSDSEASRSRSPSPDKSASGSPASHRSGSRRSRSNSPQSNKSGSPDRRSGSGSARSASGSPVNRSRSNSAESSGSQKNQRSPSGSPKSNRSARSSRKSASGSPKSNHSGSPKSHRSASGSPKSNRSGSGSPKNRSRSGTPKSNRSRSGSPQSHRSGSGSPKARSRSGSPKSDRSRSASPKENRSRSGSANTNRSRSGTPASRRSRSRSAKGSRSKSPSPARSGSRTPKSNRSRSASPKQDSGDDSDVGTKQKKRKRAVLSDASGSGDDADTKKKRAGSDADSDDNLVIDAGALFGDADDISEDEEEKQAVAVDEEKEDREDRRSDAGSDRRGSDEEQEKAEDGEGEKENIPDEPAPETRIEVEIPKITTDLGKELHFVKLPNFLSVETRPFDPDTYEDEIDEEETLDEEGRARLKLKVENTMRWREVVGPQGTKNESNARFVRWSDGSMSLHLGSEIFDVYKQPLQNDHNHLFIRQGTGLQGQTVFRTKLSFRPHSTESFTHRKMTMSLADRSLKTSGIKMLSLVGKDPEAHRGELIKKEEERLRATVRRESRQKRVREKGANRGLSASYLEPDADLDSDEEAISISAIKKQHKNRTAGAAKGDRPNIYSSDEDASDIETRRARRLDRAKAIKDSDEESADADADGGSD